MITMDALKEFGAKTDDGLARCLGEESFYLMLVESALNDEQIKTLIDQIQKGDLDAAFETAHALKGIYANLSLTPLYDIVFEITENLRARKQMDYAPQTDKLLSCMHELMKLAAD
ncbi:MAG: Hpt domain-containing protein [Clostridia bacterium]|nr:Hpt domain-containing protein [Clostridia bacterium]